MNTRTIIGIVLAISLVSCTTPNTNISNTENKLNTKFFRDRAEDSYGLYNIGDWNQVYNPLASNSTYSTGSVLENTSTNLLYEPSSWTLINDTNSSGGNYSIFSQNTSNTPSLLADNYPITQGLKYTDGYKKWHHHENPDSISYNSSSPIKILPHSKNVISNGSGWKKATFERSCSYTDDYVNTSLEITFQGTNIELFGTKNKNYGKVKITVYDSNNNIEKTIDDIDRYNSKQINSIIVKIQGLKDGNHKLKMESTKTKNPKSTNYRYDFSAAFVYPSIEYTFTGSIIKYYAWVADRYGKVDVMIDGGNPERFDLYNKEKPKFREIDDDNYDAFEKKESDDSDIKAYNHCPEKEYQNKPISKLIKEYSNLVQGTHRITIEATCDKNNYSKGYVINLDKFEGAITSTVIPKVSGTFKGDILNLKILKGPNFGIADLYIDDNLKTTIDMYNPTLRYEIIKVDVNQSFTTQSLNDKPDESLYHFPSTYSISSCYDYCSPPTPANRTFKLVGKNIKNPASTNTSINFDGVGYIISRYSFIGTSIEYIATKSNDQGIVDVYFDGNYNSSHDLYSLDSKYQQSILILDNLTRGDHIIEIRPSGKKNPSSTNYLVNVDYFQAKHSTELKGKVGKD